MPVGINTLNNVVSKVCKSLDVTLPNYTNHSLRATAASRIFEKGVPEKIIAAIEAYQDYALMKGLLNSKQKPSVMQCYARIPHLFQLLLLMIIQ